MPEAIKSVLISGNDLAKLLDVDLRTVRKFDYSGKLPRPVRLGKSVKWRVEEIQRWIDAGCPDRKTWEASNRKGGA